MKQLAKLCYIYAVDGLTTTNGGGGGGVTPNTV